jgi:hypothetical protein
MFPVDAPGAIDRLPTVNSNFPKVVMAGCSDVIGSGFFVSVRVRVIRQISGSIPGRVRVPGLGT